MTEIMTLHLKSTLRDGLHRAIYSRLDSCGKTIAFTVFKQEKSEEDKELIVIK